MYNYINKLFASLLKIKWVIVTDLVQAKLTQKYLDGFLCSHLQKTKLKNLYKNIFNTLSDL